MVCRWKQGEEVTKENGVNFKDRGRFGGGGGGARNMTLFRKPAGREDGGPESQRTILPRFGG